MAQLSTPKKMMFVIFMIFGYTFGSLDEMEC
jgi:hypothetical protein